MHNILKSILMSINLIKKSLLPLFLATILLGGFFLQFRIIYPYLIDNFRDEKLYVLYSHLTVYTFLVLIIFTSFSNLINHFFLKSKIFITVTILTLLIFYILLAPIIGDFLDYFIHLPLSEDGFMGIIIFLVTTFGYAIYTLIVLFFNRFIPLSHIFIFFILGLGYSIFFINGYCYPILDIFSKF